MFKIFYGDTELSFRHGPAEAVPVHIVPAGESFANIVENLEKYKQVAVVADDPEGELRRFMANFRLVDAAGGVVTGPGGSLLMILRNGRWDLPKGHREKDEQPLACALREVYEETAVEVGTYTDDPLLTETLHFYPLHGEWILKRTYWYAMRAAGDGVPVPQTAEGITAVEWVPSAEVQGKAAGCFPSVREVLAAGGWLTR
ncbi:MAG: NUDIX domain-containing protein [Alistipes sp.]|nr:NUDIX domain-containing protein [Alistipes sp.]